MVRALGTISSLAVALCLIGCQGPSPEGPGQTSEELSWVGVVGRVTGDQAYVQDRPEASLEGGHNASVVEDGRLYPVQENCGLRRHFPRSTLIMHDSNPGLDGYCFHADGSCLSFTGVPATENCASDRIEVELVNAGHPDPSLPTAPLGQWRFLRFYLKVGVGTLPAAEDRVIAQVWQAHSQPTGQAKQPALGVYLVDTPWRLQFRYSNDDVIFEAPAHVFHEEPVGLGEWHNFHIAMKARPLGEPAGAIYIWRDEGLGFVPQGTARNQSPPSEYQFNWGYRVQGMPARCVPPYTKANCPAPEDGSYFVSPFFSVRVGLYRAPTQEGGALSWVNTQMDSLKLTSTAPSMAGY